MVNLTTSAAIDDIAAKYCRRVYRTPVGEANVVEMIQAVRVVSDEAAGAGSTLLARYHY